MRIHRIRLDHFKGIDTREVTFPDTGVVIISGGNEVGKTSLVEALDMVLNEKHTASKAYIKNARPVGGDEPPSVEVDLTLGEHRLVLSKTWLKGPKASLRFLDGPRRGEQLSGDEANAAFERLWTGRDDVLWQALRLLQATGLDQQQLGGSRTLAAVLDESAQDQGDEDATDTVLDRAQIEYLRYFTPTGKPNKDLERVRRAVEEARTEHEEARRGVASLETARDALAAAITAFDDLSGKVAGATAEVEAWAVKEAEVVGVLARHQQAADRLRTAQLARDVAEATKQSRDELLERVAVESDRVRVAQVEVDELAEREAARADQHTALEERVLTATGQVASLTQETQRVGHRRAHLLDLAALEDRRRLLAEIDARRQELAQLRAADRPELDDAYFRSLDEAHARANEARWRLEASSARLHLEVLGDHPVLVDGQNIERAWEHTVTQSTLVEVPEVVRIRIDAATDAELREAAETAQTQWRQTLAVARVEDMTEAAALRDRLEGLRVDARLAESRLEHVLEGQDETELRVGLDELEARVRTFDGPETPADVAECDQALSELAERLDQAERELLESTALRDADARSAQELRDGLAKARGRLEAARQDAERVQAQLTQQRTHRDDESVVGELEQAVREVEVATLEDRQVSRELEALGAESITEDARLARSNLEGLRQACDQADRRRIEARADLSAMQPDQLQARLDRAATQLESAQATAEAWELRASRAKMLFDTLTAHRQATQARYVEPFRREVAALGRVLHSDGDFDVRISQDLAIESRFLQGQWLPFGSLSTGAREQLVILVRVAAARLVQPEDKVPVILDDALGYADQLRLRRMWNALARAGEDCQVVILTANPERYAGVLEATRIDLPSTR